MMEKGISGRRKKVFSLALMVLLAVVMVMGYQNCGKGGGGRTKAKGGGDGRPTCPGCGSNRWASALGESPAGSMDSVQLALDFYSNQAEDGDSLHLNDIEAAGHLDVNNFNGFGLCDIPPGRYSVESTQAGTVTGSGLLTQMELQAFGPVEVKMGVNSFSFISVEPELQSCAGHGYGKEIVGRIAVLEADGKDCGFKVLTLATLNGYQSFSCNN